jgi:hypothetical protein
MNDSQQNMQLRPVPLAAGMLIGGLTGFAIWIATDTFALFPAFLGVGVVLGLVFSRARRSLDDADKTD